MKSVDAKQVKQWLDKKEAVLVDVREVAEHQSKAIPEAKNVPVGEITLEKIVTPESQKKKLVIHCQSGRRSQAACQKLLSENGDIEIYNLDGGIVSWEAAGLPTYSQGKNTLPLDRQVQLTIGFLILIGLAIGTWLTPLGYLISAIMGAGLIMAGLTGWCGLALLMKYLPWNKSK